MGKDEKGATMAKLVELQAYLCIQCSSLMYKGFLVYTLEDAKLGLWEQVFSRRWIFLLRMRMLKMNSRSLMSYMPAISYKTPKMCWVFYLQTVAVMVYRPFVLSEHVDDKTSWVRIVDNGTIKTSADIRFRP